MLTNRRSVVVAGLVVVALVAAGVVVIPRLLGGDDGPDPAADAQAYLAAWGEGDAEAMAARVASPPAGFADDLAAITEGLAITGGEFEVGEVTEEGDTATVAFSATLALGGLGDWSYDGSLAMVRDESGDGWLVDWSPAAVHPDLAEGQRLARTRDWPARAAITGAGGAPLVEAQEAVTVGIQPSRMQDVEAVKAALQAELGVDPADVDAALGAPGVQPDHLVPIVTVSRERFEAVRDVIYPIPGLLFPEATLRAGPTEGYAQHVLGRLGDLTAERLEELGGPYQAGDQVGVTGLEAQFESRLAGTPSGEVQILPAEGSEGAGGEPVATLATIEGTAPQPLATTIDPAVQAAVETAIGTLTKPGAIVVVDPQGNIRGAASRPLSEDLNRALAGTYPPGSTFKVVTADALLGAGITPETTVQCPATAQAGGYTFRNFESSSSGPVPFSRAFAESCNTAFVTSVAPVPVPDLTAAAGRFGFNAEYSVGLNTEGGSYPEPSDETDKAAAAIGQGRVTASPLHMATVAGAVIDGSWEPPVLLPEEEPATEPPAATTLDPAHRDALAGLMRGVVTEGSGTAVDIPGQEIGGKSGTAEFGTGDPLPTHAWFIAWRGQLAASVFIEDGGVGGRDAAPVARTLFDALPA